MILCVFDLEATCWKDATKEQRKEMETIEIGAMCYNNVTQQILGTFQDFIKPKRHTELSDFCKNLTTITQKQVDDALSFFIVCNKFDEWINSHKTNMMCSWGGFDIGLIKRDCQYHNMKFPKFVNKSHMDLKKEIGRTLNINKRGLANTLKYLNLDFEGTQHRALADVENMVKILQHLKF